MDGAAERVEPDDVDWVWRELDPWDDYMRGEPQPLDDLWGDRYDR